MGSVNRRRMRFVSVWSALVVSTLSAPVFAQLAQRWERVEPAGNVNFGHSGRAVALSDGSVVRAGTRVAPAPGIAKDVLLTRYLPDGNTLWSHAFGPALASDTAMDLSIDPTTGELLLVGATRSAGATSDDLRLSRFDVQGNLIWTTTWATAFDEDPRFVRGDASGAIWVVGRSLSSSPSFTPIQFLLGFTSGGAQFASVPMPTSYGEFGLAAHPLGGIALTHDVFVPNPGGGTFLRTSRIDSAGNVLWTQSLPASGPDIILVSVRRLVCDAAGNVYVCGSAPGQDALIVKYDASGALLWARAFDDGTGFMQVLVSLDVDSQGASVGVGLSVDTGTYDVLTFVMRCDPAGNVTWSRLSNPFGGAGENGWSDVALDLSGVAFTAGYVQDAAHRLHGVVARYERDGTVRAVLRHDSASGAGTGFLQCVRAGNGDAYAVGITNGLLTVLHHEQGVPFCVGDGSATPCPCGNSSATYEQAGCRHNLTAASRLVDRGVARISADSLVIEVRGAPLNGPVLFVQGDQRANGGSGFVYGDGLACVGGNVVRLPTVPASGGVAHLGPLIHFMGGIASPGVFTYQAFHRSSASFCTPAATGTSNGLEITWSP